MKLPHLRGRVAFVFKDTDFDVDQIVGVNNIRLQDGDELVKVAMKSYDPQFASLVRPGDVLVGGANFGYGHPHYPPMVAMRRLGISCVIAESFSPGYWWGETAEGFAQITCPGVLNLVRRWDDIEVDWQRGLVCNHTTGCAVPFEPLSQSERSMIAAGGLIPYLKQPAPALPLQVHGGASSSGPSGES